MTYGDQDPETVKQRLFWVEPAVVGLLTAFSQYDIIKLNIVTHQKSSTLETFTKLIFIQ